MIKSYEEMLKLKTFEDRFNYLKLNGRVGSETFGYDRYLNQTLYRSYEWRRLREKVIIRDNGCDLGVDGYQIFTDILIHHINPITIEMIENRDPFIFDMDNLISTSHETHNAIHYGAILTPNDIPRNFVERTPNDTKLWR